MGVPVRVDGGCAGEGAGAGADGSARARAGAGAGGLFQSQGGSGNTEPVQELASRTGAQGGSSGGKRRSIKKKFGRLFKKGGNDIRAASTPQVFHVQLPDNVRPGMRLQVRVPEEVRAGGEMMTVVVPEKVPPGGRFAVP